MQTKPTPFLLGWALCLAAAALAGCSAGGGGSASGGGGGRLADLVAVDLTGVPPNGVPAGQTFPLDLEFTFANDGAAVTRPFSIGIYLSTDTAVDPFQDTPVATEIISGLAEGERRQKTIPVTLPALFPGQFWVGAFIDADPPTYPGGIIESDELNNDTVDTQILTVFSSPPSPPKSLIGEDTMLVAAGQWILESDVLLLWDAVPGAGGYNVYWSDSSATGPWEMISVPGQIQGKSIAAGFNIHAFVHGDSINTFWNIPIEHTDPQGPHADAPAGLNWYRVETVDVVGQESSGGPVLEANHVLSGGTPVSFPGGSPGGSVINPALVATTMPQFTWDSPYTPAEWTFYIVEVGGTGDFAWVYHGFSPGQNIVTLDYGESLEFTLREAVPLQPGRTYYWWVVGHDAAGWAEFRSEILAIQIQ